MPEKMVLMQGNEACVRGAIAGGMTFYAGYPITPSTEIAEISALLLPKIGGKFIQMEDEISSVAAIIGASSVGSKAMTATSGPGFSLMQENIGLAAIAEMPCVIVDVQRAGPSTGMPTAPSQGDVMQSRWGTHGDHPVVVLSPSNVQETYTLIIRAFNISEKYRTPVIFLMDEMVGHLREGIRIPDVSEIEVIDRELPDPDDENWIPFQADPETLIPKIPPFGTGRRYHITGLMHDEQGYATSKPELAHNLVERLMRKIEFHRDEIVDYEEYLTEDAETVIVCYGGTTRAARKAVNVARSEGKKVGMFRPISIWPLADKELLELSKRVKNLLVVEHNYGQLVREVQRDTKGNCPIEFLGTVDGSTITPSRITEKLKEVYGK